MNDETLNTYNNAARELAEYMSGIGSRVKYIEQALDFVSKTDGSADVLELGCGDGRDAVELIKHCRTYTGIDYSKELIKLARQLLPAADFRVADMQNFDYPFQAYDVIFAFASILHLDKVSLKDMLELVHRALKIDGVFYLTTKYAPKYQSRWKQNEYGNRLFYYYHPNMLKKLAAEYFDVAYASVDEIAGKPWVVMALRKK